MFLLLYCIMEGLFYPMNEKTFLGLQFPTLFHADCMSPALAAHSQVEVVSLLEEGFGERWPLPRGCIHVDSISVLEFKGQQQGQRVGLGKTHLFGGSPPNPHSLGKSAAHIGTRTQKVQKHCFLLFLVGPL